MVSRSKQLMEKKRIAKVPGLVRKLYKTLVGHAVGVGYRVLIYFLGVRWIWVIYPYIHSCFGVFCIMTSIIGMKIT